MPFADLLIDIFLLRTIKNIMRQYETKINKNNVDSTEEYIILEELEQEGKIINQVPSDQENSEGPSW